MKKFFTLLAVALLANVASAGIIVDVVPASDAAPDGFSAFTIQLRSTDGNTVGGVRNLSVTGIHQVWQNAAGAGDTPNQGDAAGGVFGSAAWAGYDSYIRTTPATNLSPGFGLVETNDASNPGQVNVTPPAPFNAFPGSAGIGSLGFNSADATMAFLAPQPTTVDLVRAVLLAGGQGSYSFEASDESGNFATFTGTFGGGGGGDGVLEAGPDVLFALPVITDFTVPSTLADAIVLNNTGDAPLTIDGASFATGTYFTVEAGVVGTVIAPGGSATFDVTFSGVPDPSIYPPGTLLSDVFTVTSGDQSVGIDVAARVPEPSTIALAGLGLVGLVGLARRRS